VLLPDAALKRRMEGNGRYVDGEVLDKAIRQNVVDNVAKLRAAGPVLSAAVEQGKLKISGGIYRLTTGTVDLIAQS
jgi:carbonic anhydrase